MNVDRESVCYNTFSVPLHMSCCQSGSDLLFTLRDSIYLNATNPDTEWNMPPGMKAVWTVIMQGRV